MISGGTEVNDLLKFAYYAKKNSAAILKWNVDECCC